MEFALTTGSLTANSLYMVDCTGKIPWRGNDFLIIFPAMDDFGTKKPHKPFINKGLKKKISKYP